MYMIDTNADTYILINAHNPLLAMQFVAFEGISLSEQIL